MWSGLDTLNKIDEALHSVRTEAVRLDTKLAQMTQQTAAAEHRRMQIIHEIARVRLKGIESGELDDVLAQADRDVQLIMENREAAFEQLNQAISEQHEIIGRQEEHRSELLSHVNKISQKISETELAVQSALAQDAAYKSLLDAATWARAVAEESRIKVESAQSNMAEKAVPFKSDALFMYLWERGFGTPNYKAGLFARWLDAQVARLIKYEPARINYWNLTEIPLRLERHATALAEQADEKLIEVQQYEITARANAQIPLLEDRAETARQSLDHADDQLADQEEDLNELLAQRARYVGGDDQYTQQCLSRLAAALDHRDLDAVYRYALMTASPTDDQLILDLSELEQNNQSVKSDLQGLRTLHERQIDRLEGIEAVRRQFKGARFDDSRSRFTNEGLVATTLSQFIQGLVSHTELWGTLKRNQRYINASEGSEIGSGALGGALGRGSLATRQRRRGGTSQSSWNIPRARSSASIGSARRSGSNNGKFKTGGSF